MNKQKSTERVHFDDTSILLALLGLKDVLVLKLVQEGGVNRVFVEQCSPDARCPDCGLPGRIHERPEVELCDVPGFHMQTRIIWKKHAYACVNGSCEVKTFTSQDPRIAASRNRVTSRLARQMTSAVAQGRTVKEVASEIGCSDKTVEHYVNGVANELFDHKDRILRKTSAIGIDEVFFCRERHRKYKQFATSITDLNTGKVIEVLEGKSLKDLVNWFMAQPLWWRQGIRHVTIDMCSLFRGLASRVFPNATITVDRFHVVKLANAAIDAVRVDIQDSSRQTRGEKRKDHVLYRHRKLFRTNRSSLKPDSLAALEKALELGDPDGHLAIAHLTKEGVRDLYTLEDNKAHQRLEAIVAYLKNPSLPQALQKLGRTLKAWSNEILNWHHSHLTNAKAEAANNHIKRIKRLGYGFKNFKNFRNRVLLIASDIDQAFLRSLDIRTLGVKR